MLEIGIGIKKFISKELKLRISVTSISKIVEEFKSSYIN